MKRTILLFLLYLIPVLTLKADAPPQKVIYLSIPKSGTHLLRKAIELLTEENSYWLGLSNFETFNPLFAKNSPYRVFGGHLFPEIERFRGAFTKHFRKILMIRDPRDVMLSFMFHIYNGMTWNGCPTFDHARFRALSFDDRLKETLLFPFESHNPACTFSFMSSWMKDPGVFICRFEDLVGEEGGGSRERQIHTLRGLAEFLELSLSEERIAQVADQLFGGTWTFRKGQIGAWKESYSEENKVLFKRLFGNYVIDFGYEKYDTWE